MSNKGLHLKNITLYHNGTPMLAVDHHVGEGEVLTVMGPSGSGKSTLLNLISGFLPPSFTFDGTLHLYGEDITRADPSKRHVGIMFQDALLFPHMSVEDNLLFALPRGGTKMGRCDKVRAALDAVGMAELGARDPLTLSGGQQSRISLIRVLLSEPKALLLDEPFAALDSEMKGKVRDFVFSRARERRLPTILVTHDKQDAKAAGGHIITI